MSSGRNLRIISWALVLIALSATGCAKRVMIPVGDVGADTTRFERRDVAGWVDRHGASHPVEGYVEAAGDSLRFVTPEKLARGLERDRPGHLEIVHRDSVAAVTALQTDVVATVGMVALMALLIAASVGMAAFSSFNNEPLL